MNAYYLRKRDTHSSVTDRELRQRFEDRMKAIGYRGDWLKSARGDYVEDNIQAQWEGYYNGFRDGEDER